METPLQETESKDFCEELTKFAPKIATKAVDQATIEACNMCRFIPLDKNPGSSKVQISHYSAYHFVPLSAIGVIEVKWYAE